MPRSSSPVSKQIELRACLECRKRKSKCSGGSPCQYCSRSKKQCVYGRAPSRTPLTRKNLDETERRCAKLMALLHKLNPDVDIEVALKHEGFEFPLKSLQSADSEIESPASVDRFEWNEAALASPSRSQKECPDGMASLVPSGRAGCGYLGNSSGSHLLRNISGLFPDNPDSVATEQTSPVDASQIESPSWSAHLSNTAVLDRLVDAYFMCYNSSFPILHESTFRQKYRNRQQIHLRSSWHPIFYLVLAIGDWILAGGAEAEQSRYYTAARSRMSMRMLESGNLLTVQAFLLMGNYLQKRDRPNTGYNFIGIAYRMALGLGLHREPPADTPDSLFNERRRVVWWIVYCFDSGFSLTTGRPVMASDGFIETRLPRNIDDSACTLDSILPAPTEEPTTYSAIIAQARLSSIGNMVYRDVISASKETPLDLRVARSIDHQFKAWKLSLPVYFTAQDIPHWFHGPRAIIRWKEENVRMMLWWGSQRLCSLPSDSDEAQNMCHYTAIETIQDITTFCLDHPDTLHAGTNWYATYFLFQATIVLSIHYLRPCQSRDTTATQELWFLSISRARDCLAFLSTNNKAASRCLAVLDRIRDQSQPSQPASTPVPPDPDSAQLQTIPGDPGMHSPTFAIDPALQIFFQDTTWDNDIFEGLQGFPSTDEIESFDYVRLTDPSLEPS
ncbi:hypothetical protein MW887_011827 [Aspergillus wentii]|nr:hypothetical protein MW887_011827 [Aspergillus wentii]